MKRLSERQCTEKRNPRHWHCPRDLRQGVGGCVGYAITHALISEPNSKQYGSYEAAMINSEAERIEGVAGIARPGTSVLSGLNAAINLGYIVGYEVAESFDDLKAMLKRGPVVVGLNMFQGMDRPLPWCPEWIGITNKKKRIGTGHAMCALGHDDRWFNGRFTYLQNSGGSEYGRGGIVYLGDGDMKFLFKTGNVVAYRPVLKESK